MQKEWRQKQLRIEPHKLSDCYFRVITILSKVNVTTVGFLNLVPVNIIRILILAIYISPHC